MIKKLIKKMYYFFAKTTKKNIYVVNNNTKEIHHLNKKHKNCNIDLMTNITYITEKELKSYLDSGSNGCRWCLKDKDNG